MTKTECPHLRVIRLLWSFSEEQRQSVEDAGGFLPYSHQVYWCVACNQIIGQERSRIFKRTSDGRLVEVA